MWYWGRYACQDVVCRWHLALLLWDCVQHVQRNWRQTTKLVQLRQFVWKDQICFYHRWLSCRRLYPFRALFSRYSRFVRLMLQVCQRDVSRSAASLPSPLNPVYIGCLFLHRFNQHTSGTLLFFLSQRFHNCTYYTFSRASRPTYVTWWRKKRIDTAEAMDWMLNYALVFTLTETGGPLYFKSPMQSMWRKRKARKGSKSNGWTFYHSRNAFGCLNQRGMLVT